MSDEWKQVGDFEARVKDLAKWVHKPVVAGVTGALLGVFDSFLFEFVFKTVLPIQKPIELPLDPVRLARFGNYQPLARSVLEASGWAQARHFAVVRGVYTSISCVMEQVRCKKEDVHTCLVATFGSAVTLSLVNGLRGREAITVGVLFALMNGGFFKGCEKLSKVKDDVVCYGNAFFTGNALALHAADDREAEKGRGRKT